MRIGFSNYNAETKFPFAGEGVSRCSLGVSGRGSGLWLSAIIASVIAIPAFAETDAKTVTSKKYVDDQIATKQPILNAAGTDLRNNVVMYTDQAGEVTAKPISTTLSGTGIDNDLPTVGAVNTGLATKQDELSGTSGNVVTYTSNAGTLGEHAVYKTTTTYDTTNAGALVEANHANSAIAKGLNEHLTCAPNGIDPVSNNCWLWQINDQAAGTVYTDHQ